MVDGANEAELQGPDASAQRSPGQEPPGWTARKLLRAARAATLATHSNGWPFAGLVTPATDADLAVLMLLSDLSEHTKQLRRDARCALLVTGEAAEVNPQTTPRVTVSGRAVIAEDERLRARFLAVHPYASPYADFGDFHLWRVVPEDALLVAGFARAHRLRPQTLLPAAEAVSIVSAAAPGILSHCNADHADTLALLAAESRHREAGDSGPGEWRMVGVDIDGCDLAGEHSVLRVAWPEPVADAHGVRKALIELARAARAKTSQLAP